MRPVLAPALLLLAAGLALAQRPGPAVLPPPTPKDRPDLMVIEPRKPAAPTAAPGKPGGVEVLKGVDPDRPGFLVISPNRVAASTLLPPPHAASRVEERGGVPHVVIVGTGAKQPPATDPTGGKPAGGAKPVQPEPEKVADGKILLETYDVAHCRGCKVGYLHTLVREYERDGKKVVYGVKRMVFQVARFGQPAEQWAEESTVEDADGKVLATRMRQGIGKNQVLSLSGEVTDKGLVVQIEGPNPGTETVKWPAGVVGVAKEATLLKDTRPKPGVGIEYRMYFGGLNRIAAFKLTAHGAEEVTVAPGGKPQRLLKLVQEMQPIDDFKLPPTTVWVDPDTYEPVKLETEVAMLGGRYTAVRSTKEKALAKPTRYLDLGEVQSVPLAAAVPGLHQKEAVTYRVTLGGDLPLEKVFPADGGRQAVAVVDAKARVLDLTVTAVRTPAEPKDPPAPPGKEYLADCYFIDWDNEPVRRHAAAAVAGLPRTATAWDKARAVEGWVHKHVRQVEFSQALGTCGNTAKELSGDCTEHAMLAAGMCRALSIPSRTALGLVYADTRNGPTLAYHMWFEVWAGGRWLALDPIMGLGSVGPGHLKITDAHWHEEKGLTPMLPVMTVLGMTPKVEVVSR